MKNKVQIALISALSVVVVLGIGVGSVGYLLYFRPVSKFNSYIESIRPDIQKIEFSYELIADIEGTDGSVFERKTIIIDDKNKVSKFIDAFRAVSHVPDDCGCGDDYFVLKGPSLNKVLYWRHATAVADEMDNNTPVYFLSDESLRTIDSLLVSEGVPKKFLKRPPGMNKAESPVLRRLEALCE